MHALLVIAALLLTSAPALAQSSPQELERMKRMLEERLGSGQRGVARPQEAPLKPTDFQAVKRGTSERRSRGGTSDDRRSSLDGPAPAAAAVAGIAAAHAKTRTAPDVALHVRRDRYAIQLKANLTDEQLDAAIERLTKGYNLDIVKHNSTLGILYVSPRDAARSVGPAQRAPESLGAALEPQIIKDLRRESFVDAAYVDFLVTPKSVPRRSDAKAKAGAASFAWHWRTGESDDGNWGLKLLRMPPVWTVLHRVRKIDPARQRTRMAFLDVGFGSHGHLAYNEVLGGMPANPSVADCGHSHGTHVAGIAGALHGKGRGIDGMIPDSRIDAIPVGSDLWVEGANIGIANPIIQRSVLFSGAIDTLTDFIELNPLKPGERRVINVSLGYNWASLNFDFGENPEADENVKAHILSTAKTVQRLALKLRDAVLIVAAAGNDSEGADPPDQAQWATPFGFAADPASPTFPKSPNILIVEAVRRDGARASFSNVGGSVSAPGVDIMSTLSGVSDAYGVCSGTSQATPHVTAIAAILFELDPSKTPAQVAEIIRSSAIPGAANTAPRVDALAAVLKLSKDNLRYLADLNSDGKVDIADLQIVKTHFAVLEEAKGGKAIGIDLNGDGNVDEDERCWPLVDFNGSGKASLLEMDAVSLDGRTRSDLQVFEEAWTDTAQSFRAAMAETGLEKLVAQWTGKSGSIALTSSVPGRPAPCQ
jgi:hypothetical protein